LIIAFIDECRHADLVFIPICRVLTSHYCQIVAQTARPWVTASKHVADRTVTDAMVLDVVRDAAWAVDEHGPIAGIRRLTPERLSGRRKLIALIQRTMPETSPGLVERAMKALGLNRIRRAKCVRPTSLPRTGSMPPICLIGTSPREPRTAHGSWI